MADLANRLEIEDLKENLRAVQELLHRHKLVEDLVSRQDNPKQELVEQLVHRQHLAELRGKIERLHPADIAFILESLPLEERLVVWDLVKADRDGEILLEVSDAVRESLIASMDSEELVAAAETLEADELADLAPDLPEGVIQDVIRSLPLEEREQLRAAMSYAEGSVGALMDFDMVTVREDVTLEAVTRYLRRLDELPGHTDQLFVLDRDQNLKGALPLARLIVSDLESEVGKVMIPELITFNP
jgi:magnesium transporter